MICANCKNEIGDRTECNFCGYDPSKDCGEGTNAMLLPQLPPTKVVVKKSSNGIATAGMVMGFFSWYPVLGILSLIFSFVGFKRAKYRRSGRVKSIIGIILSLFFFAVWFAIIYFMIKYGQ